MLSLRTGCMSNFLVLAEDLGEGIVGKWRKNY